MPAHRITVADVLRRIHETRPKNTPTIRALRREISNELEHEPAAAVIALAIDLARSGDPNARWVGYEFILHHPTAPRRISAAQVQHLGDGMSGWGAVDAYGCYISGPAWREGRIADDRVHRWARSKDRWRRRAALVSTIPLNVQARGGTGDAERTLGVCELLIDDRDPMVVKALSWALRALLKRDSAPVARFVAAHEERLAALVKREVREKLRGRGMRA